MFETDHALEQSYGAYFAASAYSEFRPLNPGKTEAAYEQNRRIELSVVLKDASVRGVIDEYMKTVGAPGTPAPAAPAVPAPPAAPRPVSGTADNDDLPERRDGAGRVVKA